MSSRHGCVQIDPFTGLTFRCRTNPPHQAIAYIFSALAILLTSGRLVIRWRNTGRLWIDDYLNILAAILVVPFTVLCLLVFPSEYDAQLAFLGLGGKEPTIEEVEFTQRLTFVTLLLFWLIIYAVKGSFLALYWQIFAVSNRFRYVWWFTAGYTILSFCITWISIFWQCGSPSDLNNRGKWHRCLLFVQNGL